MILIGMMLFFVLLVLGMLFSLSFGLNFIIPSLKRRYAVFLLVWMGLAIITYQTVTVLTTTSIITDPSVPFLYTHGVLKSRQGADGDRASYLHQMVVRSGITDPLGFFFDDDPSRDIPSSRKIAIVDNPEPMGRWGISRYLVRQEDGTLVPTLLKISDYYLDSRYQRSFENYLKAYLNITTENEDRIFIDVGDPFADLRIMIKDESSDDAVILIFDYSPPHGIAKVNVLYATIHYRRDDPGIEYREDIYQTIDDELKGFGFLVGFFSVIGFPTIGFLTLTFIFPLHSFRERGHHETSVNKRK